MFGFQLVEAPNILRIKLLAQIDSGLQEYLPFRDGISRREKESTEEGQFQEGKIKLGAHERRSSTVLSNHKLNMNGAGTRQLRLPNY